MTTHVILTVATDHSRLQTLHFLDHIFDHAKEKSSDLGSRMATDNLAVASASLILSHTLWNPGFNRAEISLSIVTQCNVYSVRWFAEKMWKSGAYYTPVKSDWLIYFRSRNSIWTVQFSAHSNWCFECFSNCLTVFPGRLKAVSDI